MNKIFLFVFLLLTSFFVQAQSYYTLLQVGGNLGFANEGYKGAFNGYSAHFVFGRNYDERLFIGLGLGNERLMGNYEINDPHHELLGVKRKYDQNLFPIFIDSRLPIGEFKNSSKIGLLANAGYAPAISVQYDKGFLFKGGFYYLHERFMKNSWTISAVYAYQQLNKNMIDVNQDFQHQHFNVSVGLMLK